MGGCNISNQKGWDIVDFPGFCFCISCYSSNLARLPKSQPCAGVIYTCTRFSSSQDYMKTNLEEALDSYTPFSVHVYPLDLRGDMKP